jgi:hypothetical protein
VCARRLRNAGVVVPPVTVGINEVVLASVRKETRPVSARPHTNRRTKRLLDAQPHFERMRIVVHYASDCAFAARRNTLRWAGQMPLRAHRVRPSHPASALTMSHRAAGSGVAVKLKA